MWNPMRQYFCSLLVCHAQHCLPWATLFAMSNMFFSFFFFVISSLHLALWPAAWVTFNGDGSNWPCFLLQPIFLNASWLLRPPSTSFCLSFLSLSSIHILRIESLFHTLRAWDRVLFEHPPWRVSGRSRAGIPVLFPIQFPHVSILMRWRNF